MSDLRSTLWQVLSPLIAGTAVAWLWVAPVLGGSIDIADEETPGYKRIERSYDIPDVTLENRHGEVVRLPALLDEDRPVLVQFIFTSCQSICPMLTAMMAQAQERVREVAPDTKIVSISIDPQYDTPQRLRKYADKHNARGDWTFLTGEWSKIRRTMNAFDAMYEGKNKMYHKPYTYMRPASGDEWVRLQGLMGAHALVAEYRRVLGSSQATAGARP